MSIMFTMVTDISASGCGHRRTSGSLFLQKATHDLDIINSIVGLKPVSVAAFGSRLVYGGDKPNDLTCDNCREKMTCPMSVHRLYLEAAKPLPPKHQRLCVYAKEIDIDDNQVMIIQYEGGVTASYCQTFNAPQHGGCRGGRFIGTGGIMELQYYGEFVENSKNEILFGNSQIILFIGESLTLIVLISFSILVSGIVFTNIASHGHTHYHKGMFHIHMHSHHDGHHNHIHDGDSDKSLRHSHIHKHEETKHTHKHYPDLHHRHEH